MCTKNIVLEETVPGIIIGHKKRFTARTSEHILIIEILDEPDSVVVVTIMGQVVINRLSQPRRRSLIKIVT